MNDPNGKLPELKTNNKCDKVQLYNFTNNNRSNHQTNHHHHHLKNGLKKPRAKKVSSPGLTARDRKSINIDSICHLNWMLIILLFTLINLYEFGYLDSRCKEFKSTMITFSRLISSLTAIETTTYYLVWTLLTNSRYYHMQTVYDAITGAHIFISFLNILFAVTTFLTRTCHENKLTTELDFHNVDKLHLLALKYDLKIAGIIYSFIIFVLQYVPTKLGTNSVIHQVE